MLDRGRRGSIDLDGRVPLISYRALPGKTTSDRAEETASLEMTDRVEWYCNRDRDFQDLEIRIERVWEIFERFRVGNNWIANSEGNYNGRIICIGDISISNVWIFISVNILYNLYCNFFQTRYSHSYSRIFFLNFDTNISILILIYFFNFWDWENRWILPSFWSFKFFLLIKNWLPFCNILLKWNSRIFHNQDFICYLYILSLSIKNINSRYFLSVKKSDLARLFDTFNDFNEYNYRHIKKHGYEISSHPNLLVAISLEIRSAAIRRNREIGNKITRTPINMSPLGEQIQSMKTWHEGK